jgi:hypothetical protein
MKKAFVTVTFFFVALVTFGQSNSQTFNEFFVKYQELEGKYQKACAAKQFNQSETLLKEMITLCSNLQLSDEENSKHGADVKQIMAGTYYNQACVYSLQKKKTQAINAFEEAINLGWNEYRHTKNDSDFDNIRTDKRFMALLDRIKVFDKLTILQSTNAYQQENSDSLPKFTYQSAENGNLKNVKEYFKLDSIAGSGNEIAKILNILKWAHDNIRHDGNNWALCEFDAIDIYNYSKASGKGVNCRHLAIALNEMYLSMGIPSRYITCMPKNTEDTDCHVINSVYSKQLQKWIWIDPTFNAYVKDENGNLLSIAEVRERLIKNQPLVLNEDANWNNENKQTKEHYLETYMAKNLYWFQCVDYSRFNPESRYRAIESKYISLLPLGFELDLPKGIISPEHVTHDPDYFWKKPE